MWPLNKFHVWQLSICLASSVVALVALATTSCQGPMTPEASVGFPLVEKWHFKTDRDIVTALSTDSDIIVARTKGEIIALDVLTGSLRWRRQVPESIVPSPPAHSPPLVGQGLVVVVTYKGVTALNSNDGTTAWEDSQQWFGLDAFPAAISSESVYIVGYDVIVYERTTGRISWRVELVGSPRNTAAIFLGEGTVFLISRDRLQVREMKSGELLWEDVDKDWAPRAATFHSGVIYYGTGNGEIAAFDTQSKRGLWRIRGRLSGFSPLATDERVFVGSVGTPLALDAATGELMWQSSIDSGTYQTPMLFRGTLYVREMFTRKIYALSMEDGAELGHLVTGNPVQTASDSRFPLGPIATDTLLIFPAGDTVYAYGK